MAKIKEVLSKIRNKLRRAISAQSTDSEQPHSVQDAKDEDNMVQLGSNFIEDIHNKWVYRRTALNWEPAVGRVVYYSPG